MTPNPDAYPVLATIAALLALSYLSGCAIAASNRRKAGRAAGDDPRPSAYWISHAAWAAERDPVGPAESDALWANWLARDRDRMERAAGRAGTSTTPGDHESAVGRHIVARNPRKYQPVVVVADGPRAGVSVRVLLASRDVEGAWFVEVLEGRGRGDVTVLGGGELWGGDYPVEINGNG